MVNIHKPVSILCACGASGDRCCVVMNPPVLFAGHPVRRGRGGAGSWVGRRDPHAVARCWLVGSARVLAYGVLRSVWFGLVCGGVQ